MSISFEDLLVRDGKLVYRTRGVSMEPMLRQDRDLVVINAVTEETASRLQPLDVAMYKRGRCFVLHRVIRVCDGYYLIRGDNTYMLEKVPFEDVLGVLTAFQRKGRHYDTEDRAYRRYARFWNAIYPLRAFLIFCRRLAVRVARRLGLVPLLKKMLRKGSGR